MIDPANFAYTTNATAELRLKRAAWVVANTRLEVGELFYARMQLSVGPAGSDVGRNGRSVVLFSTDGVREDGSALLGELVAKVTIMLGVIGRDGKLSKKHLVGDLAPSKTLRVE